MRIVLDTNALLSSISRKSQFREIFDKILDGSITLAVSSDILLEYEEIISARSAPHIAENILKGFEDRPNVEHKIISYKWDIITHDPDDNKFVDCYIAAGADYLVTNDHHFDVLSPDDFPPVRVVSIEAFLEIMQMQSDKGSFVRGDAIDETKELF